MKSLNAVLLSAGLVMVPCGMVAAQGQRSTAMVVAASHEGMVDGEVRKVDLAAKKLTIKHSELKNLDMPAMTMVFQVKDPAMLEKVKVGDKVKFRADKIGGAFTVVELEPVR